MATKQEIMNKINTIIDDNAVALKDFNKGSMAETKASLDEKLSEVENAIFQIEAGGTPQEQNLSETEVIVGDKKSKTKKEKGKMKKGDKKGGKKEQKQNEKDVNPTPPTEPAVIDKNVTEKQYDLLLLLETKATPVEDLKDEYANKKIPHLLLKQLEDKGLCQILKVETNDVMVKKALITHAGEEVRDADWVKPPQKESKPRKKKEFVPIHSDEDLAGMKKKARKAAVKENEAAKIAFDEKASTPRTKTPSTYIPGTIPRGKHQKKDFMENPSEIHAAWDLWEEVVTKKFKMTRTNFILLADEKGLKRATAASQWSKIYAHHGFTKDEVTVLLGGKAPKKGKEEAEKSEASQIVDDKADKKAAKKAKKAAKQAKKDKAGK